MVPCIRREAGRAPCGTLNRSLPGVCSPAPAVGIQTFLGGVPIYPNMLVAGCCIQAGPKTGPMQAPQLARIHSTF